MSIELQEIIGKAIDSRESIRIIYHGGSQPGSQREIRPISFNSSETRARDIATGIVKTFFLSKIELVNSNSNLPVYDPTLPPKADEFKTIEQALTSNVQELIELGWHVILTTSSISLHGYFMNGKPRKGSEVSLSYDEYISESFFDPNTGKLIDENRKSTRPYRIYSGSFPTARTFTHLSKAVELFWIEAKSRAPKNAS